MQKMIKYLDYDKCGCPNCGCKAHLDITEEKCYGKEIDCPECNEKYIVIGENLIRHYVARQLLLYMGEANIFAEIFFKEFMNEEKDLNEIISRFNICVMDGKLNPGFIIYTTHPREGISFHSYIEEANNDNCKNGINRKRKLPTFFSKFFK